MICFVLNLILDGMTLVNDAPMLAVTVFHSVTRETERPPTITILGDEGCSLGNYGSKGRYA